MAAAAPVGDGAAGGCHGSWVYLAAPPLGMLLAAAVHVAVPGRAGVRCAQATASGARGAGRDGS